MSEDAPNRRRASGWIRQILRVSVSLTGHVFDSGVLVETRWSWTYWLHSGYVVSIRPLRKAPWDKTRIKQIKYLHSPVILSIFLSYWWNFFIISADYQTHPVYWGVMCNMYVCLGTMTFPKQIVFQCRPSPPFEPSHHVKDKAIFLCCSFELFFSFCSFWLCLPSLVIQRETKRTKYRYALKEKVHFYISHPSSKRRQNANMVRSLMIGFSWLNRAHVHKAWLIQMDVWALMTRVAWEQSVSFVWKLSTRRSAQSRQCFWIFRLNLKHKDSRGY